MSDSEITGSRGGVIIARIDPDLEDLIPGYLQNRRQDLRTLTEKNEQGDFEAVRAIAHKITGTGGGYGFDRITDISGSIEQAAVAMNREGIVQGIRELADYLQRVRVVYE